MDVLFFYCQRKEELLMVETQNVTLAEETGADSRSKGGNKMGGREEKLSWKREIRNQESIGSGQQKLTRE